MHQRVKNVLIFQMWRQQISDKAEHEVRKDTTNPTLGFPLKSHMVTITVIMIIIIKTWKTTLGCYIRACATLDAANGYPTRWNEIWDGRIIIRLRRLCPEWCHLGVRFHSRVSKQSKSWVFFLINRLVLDTDNWFRLILRIVGPWKQNQW